MKRTFEQAGLAIPTWIEMVVTPPSAVADGEPTGPKFGRQQKASRQLQERFHLHVGERAMLRSQHGRRASAALTALPTNRATKIASQPFRFLLCRRLRLPSRRIWQPSRSVRAPSSALQHRCAGRSAGPDQRFRPGSRLGRV